MARKYTAEDSSSYLNSSEGKKMSERFLDAQEHGKENSVREEYKKAVVQHAETRRKSKKSSSSSSSSSYNPNLSGGDGISHASNGESYNSKDSNDFLNTDEGKNLTDRFLEAQEHGQEGAVRDEYKNAIGTYVRGKKQKVLEEEQQNKMQDFITKYTDYMKGAMEQGKLSEQLLAKNKMEQELLAQSDAQRQADKDYTDQIDGVNQGQYNAFENAKVRGMQRGVNYSAQQAGVEAGIESRGITDKRKTQETRDLKLSSIRDKINAIKSGNLNEVQAIDAKYNAKLQETMANIYMKGQERDWQVSDNYLKHDWDKENVMLQNSLNQDNMKMQQSLDLQKMSVNHGYDLEKMDTQNQYDQQKIQTMFDNDLKKMSVDQGYKKELQNMDYTFKKQFLKLETVEKKELMKFDTEQKKVIMALDHKYQKEILASQRSSSGYSSGGRYYPSSGKKYTSSQQAYSNTMDKASREMALSLVMNDPHVKVNRADVANDLVNYVGGSMTTKQFMGKYTNGSYDVPTMNQFLNKNFPNRINK